MQQEVQSAARRDWIQQSREDAEMMVRSVVHGSSMQSDVVLEHESVVREAGSRRSGWVRWHP